MTRSDRVQGLRDRINRFDPVVRKMFLWWILGGTIAVLLAGDSVSNVDVGWAGVVYGAIGFIVYTVANKYRIRHGLSWAEVRRTILNVRNYVLLLATIMVAAVAYYFLFSLPAHNRAVLALERQKQALEQQNQTMESFRREQRRNSFMNCAEEADSAFWQFIRMNAIKTTRGTMRALPSVWDQARSDKQLALEECDRKYGR